MWGSAKIAPRITPAPSHPKVMLPLRLTRLGCRKEVESGPMKARRLAPAPSRGAHRQAPAARLGLRGPGCGQVRAGGLPLGGARRELCPSVSGGRCAL